MQIKTAGTKRELPPRARRIPGRPHLQHRIPGTTSAHAENTSPGAKSRMPSWNYLRARGEYSRSSSMRFSNMELPPRTRRIQNRGSIRHPTRGTTSAHAENTPPALRKCFRSWNYLRARGEYHVNPARVPLSLELPPRTRRILFFLVCVERVIGTTSAHAENTKYQWWRLCPGRNYLRARGEYAWDAIAAGINWELPPRTRRILLPKKPPHPRTGTTSAHAENTIETDSKTALARNYLRARGEYLKYHHG